MVVVGGCWLSVGVEMVLNFNLCDLHVCRDIDTCVLCVLFVMFLGGFDRRRGVCCCWADDFFVLSLVICNLSVNR